jgi:glutathione synthase
MAMIVQPLETNLCDQRLIEHDLWAEHNIRMIRVTFEEMANQGSLDPATSALLYTLPTGEQVELSTLYFRAGYSPDDLPTDKHWEARTMMEQSQAVKCPNAACHLVGTKKMQQVLGQREKLERYLSPQEVEKVLSTFTTLVSLDPADYADQAGFDAQLEQVYQNPSEWVLKPQREGGGNNYYGQEAIDKLKSLSPQARQGYIVMAMIKPPVVTVTGLSETAEAGSMAATTEFGFYGTHLQVAGEAVLNATAGFLMRTKAASSHETGVAAGFGLLDVPMLV